MTVVEKETDEGHPVVGYKKIPLGSDPRNPYIMTEPLRRPKLDKEEAATNLIYFIILLTIAMPWLYLKAYMGVFESAWWFYKNNTDLLPEHMMHGAGLYFNRDNGVIIGFYNTSHEVELSNWTRFYDPDEKIEEEEEESESANPVLLFTIDDKSDI